MYRKGAKNIRNHRTVLLSVELSFLYIFLENAGGSRCIKKGPSGIKKNVCVVGN